MEERVSTIDIISGIFSEAVKSVIEMSTHKNITYSSTLQKIPKVCLRPEIGCFVQFNGDYNGLVIMNFSAESAMTIYTSSMVALGIPEDECAKNFTSSEVADSIGELVNQIMGQSMRRVQEKYDLASSCGQPKALALNSAIILSIDSGYEYRDNRRIVFSLDKSSRFYMELTMEQTEFIAQAENFPDDDMFE